MSFVDTLVSLFHEGDFGSVADERFEEYRKLFGDAGAEKSRERWNTQGWLASGQKYFEAMRDDILAGNPQLGPLVGCPPVIHVNTNQEISGLKQIDQNAAVVVDGFVTMLLWTFNKSWIYGRHSGPAKQHELFCNLFVHFASLQRFGSEGLVWPRPKTPAHTDQAEFGALVLITRLQETFLVAHELAHLFVQKGGARPENSVTYADYPTHYRVISKTTDPAIGDEILADELALEFVLRTLPPDEPVQCAAVTSIFLVIRYQLWLIIVAAKEDQSRDFLLWFGRNNAFRTKVSNTCPPSVRTAVVELSRELEDVFEPAALRAKEGFNLLAGKFTELKAAAPLKQK